MPLETSWPPRSPFKRPRDNPATDVDALSFGRAERGDFPTQVLYARAQQLQLVPSYDDIDALVVVDDGERNERGKLFFDPARDLVYLSLVEGSRTLTNLNWSPADVNSTGLGEGPGVFLPAQKLGLKKKDELDALDLVSRGAVTKPVAR